MVIRSIIKRTSRIRQVRKKNITLTLDQDDIDYFKGAYYNWANAPLLTIYTKNSQDVVTIKQVTITP